MKRINVLLTGLLTATTLTGLMVVVSTTLPVRAEPTAPGTSTAPAPIVKNPLPFASEIEAFEAADKKSAPPQGAVLFIGSSSIRLWATLARDFPELPVINRGFGGSQIEHSVLYADRIVIPYKPKLIVFYAGGNDINAGKTPEQVLNDFQSFADKLQGALPTTSIAFISINPSVSRWGQESKTLKVNSLIEKYIRDTNSKTRKLAYIDSHARLLGADGQPQGALLRNDGLHLNAEGYKAWIAIVRPQILTLAEEAGVERLPTVAPEK